MMMLSLVHGYEETGLNTRDSSFHLQRDMREMDQVNKNQHHHVSERMKEEGREEGSGLPGCLKTEIRSLK